MVNKALWNSLNHGGMTVIWSRERSDSVHNGALIICVSVSFINCYFGVVTKYHLSMVALTFN